MITLTREPARIAQPGVFPLPGLRANFVIGRDALAMAYPELASADHWGVDLEGCGKDGRARYDVKAVIISTTETSFVFDPRDPWQFEKVKDLLNSGKRMVFHNSPFDCPILYAIGVLDLDTLAHVTDTLLYARLAWPDRRTPKNLGAMAARVLGLEIHDPLPTLLKTLGISKSAWYANFDLDTPAYRIMAATDALLTVRALGPVRRAALNTLTTGHPFTAYGVRGSEAERLVDREQVNNRSRLRRTCRGFLVNPEYLDSYRRDNEVAMAAMTMEIESHGIRPTVAGDLTAWLNGQGLLPEDYPRTEKTHQPSGNADDLKRIAHPLVATFVDHKQRDKVERDYLSKVIIAADDDGRVHPSENLLAATTGRASVSGDFPYQQMPEAARAVLLADPGDRLTSIDWSQIEPVLMANISGDLAPLAQYEDPNATADLYAAVAGFANVPRKVAKVILLGSLYGEGIGKISRDLGVSMDQARAIQAKVWEAMPRTKDMAGRGGKLMKIAAQHKKIFTLSGRILTIPPGSWPCWDRHDPDDFEAITACTRCDDKGRQRGIQEHLGVNYPTQGGAYDLLAEALYAVIGAGLGDAVYFQMHDELVVSREAADDIRKIMETPPERLCFMAKRTPVLRTDMAHCRDDAWDMPKKCDDCGWQGWSSQAHRCGESLPEG